MRYTFLILATIFIGLNSCTTMYKTGQTPDDVYYSPGRTATDYVHVESDRNDRYSNDESYSTDRYLRMKAQQRNRWSSFDDDFYYWNNPTWNNPYYFNSFRSPWVNPWMNTHGIYSHNYWNSGFYNPFLPGFYSSPVIIVSKPVNPKVYTPRGGSLNTYNTRTVTDAKNGGRVYNISSTPRSSGSSNSSGKYYSTPSNRSYQYSNSGSSTPSRTFSSGSSNNSSNSAPRSSGSGSSGSSGSSGGSAPVRSFPRGGN